MRRGILVACAALASLAQACGNGGGASGAGGAGSAHASSSGAGGSLPCGSLVWDSANAACNQCVVDHCCDQLRACDAGTPCGDLLACVNACATGDTTCVKACQALHPAGQAAIDAAYACYDASCQPTPACGTAVCDTGVIVPDPSCGACLTMYCCDSWKLCAQDTACVQCLTTTPSPAGCDTNGQFTAAQMCTNSTCAMACANRICNTPLSAGSAACNYCLGQGCCAQAEACNGEPACLTCLQTSGKGAGCATEAKYQALETCWTGSCATACGG